MQWKYENNKFFLFADKYTNREEGREEERKEGKNKKGKKGGRNEGKKGPTDKNVKLNFSNG